VAFSRLERIEAGEQGWQGTAWALERLYPQRFARPEVMNQISLVAGGKASAGKLGEGRLRAAVRLAELRELAPEFEDDPVGIDLGLEVALGSEERLDVLQVLGQLLPFVELAEVEIERVDQGLFGLGSPLSRRSSLERDSRNSQCDEQVASPARRSESKSKHDHVKPDS
jgi:hypothetical protein